MSTPLSAVHLCFAIVSIAAGPAVGQTLTRISVSSAGVQGDEDSYVPGISADGRYVTFYSEASNLVPGDANGAADVFVHDRLNGTTKLVSLSASGAQGDADSEYPSISNDGRFVAFMSYATNLVAGDTNAAGDVFVRDLVNGTTELVSVDPSGQQGNATSYVPDISGDGRYVLFGSFATNIVAGDTNGYRDVFVRDRATGITTRVSVDSSGAQGDQGGLWGYISDDGRYVGFESNSTNLVPGDTNGFGDVFVRDLVAGTTTRVSVDSNGVQANSGSGYVTISATGRYVVFGTQASNLVAVDTNETYDVFMHDLVTGNTIMVDLSSTGVQANSYTSRGTISADGRYVAFKSTARNLVPVDGNATQDIFLRDLVAGTTELISISATGVQGDGISSQAAISADGHHIAFYSEATTLVPGDTNSSDDIFVRSTYSTPTSFCTAGVSSNGCVPTISYSGAASATAASGFPITIGAVEGQKQGLLFYGINNTGFSATPWGTSSSYLCVKAPTQRMNSQNSGGTANTCDGVLASDWNAFIAVHPSALGNPFSAGQQVFVQGWMRDPPSAKTTMLSNALEFVVAP